MPNLARRASSRAGPSFLDRRHRRAGGGAVALEAALGHVQQERLGGGDPTFDAVLADVTIWPSTAS